MLGAALGGAVVGGGVAAMHYTGHDGARRARLIREAPVLVTLSIALGVALHPSRCT